MVLNDIESAIEGILFASGDPLDAARIAAVLGVSRADVLDAAAAMSGKYEAARRGIRLVRIENSLQLCSAPELADTIRTALETGKPPRLSQAALEVLSVVAYFQPVTRAYVEQVRGVDCTNTMHVLATRGLIKRQGHLAVPGRPGLYVTTDDFLRTFGIVSLDELPSLPGGQDSGQMTLAPESTLAIPENSGGEEEGSL